MELALVKLAYIIAAVFFIFGLKFMAHPRTAVRGNLFGAIGMGIAIIAAIVEVSQLPENHYGFIVAGCLLGTGLGIYLAATVQMTSMPQLVALFNALGGLASVFVAGGALALGSVETWDALLASGVSGLIGAVTFSGSMLAAGKLKELPVFRQPIPVPGRHVIALVVVALLILCLVLLTTREGYLWLYIPITLLSLGLGFLLVNPIGGADMPVVIALFNSYS